MKPELGSPYALSFVGRPAHMSALDFVLWQRLKRAMVLPWSRIYFDVAVGGGAEAGADAAPAVLDSWQRLTRHRLDVVGEQSSGWTIVEIRAAAGPGAIGSLVCYDVLWREDAPDERPVELWLVTDQFPRALDSVTRKFNIRVLTV